MSCGVIANSSSNIELWYYPDDTQVFLFTGNFDQIIHHVQWTRICYTVDNDSEDDTDWWYLHFQYQSRCTIRGI